MQHKEPHLITFDEMRSSISSSRLGGDSFLTDNFAISCSTDRIFEDIISTGVPYRFNDSRLMLVVSGEADITVNLMNRHISPAMMGFFSKGSIIQMNHHTADFKMKTVAFGEEYLSQLAGSRLLKAHEGLVGDVVLSLTAEEEALADGYFTQLWQLMRQGIYNRDLLAAHVTAMLFFLSLLSKQHEGLLPLATTRTEELFQQFVRLVNAHHTGHRSLAFYADRLCITEKYLCLVVKKASGFTVKDWVDRALTTTAKLLLKRTDEPVGRIADRLNFPHPSSFCKFFKRMTGLTPQEYRERE